MDYVLMFVVALVSGTINGMAGGASILSFSALAAIGLDPVSAVVTNSWGLTPANFGALVAYKGKLGELYSKYSDLLWASIIGTIIGATCLLNVPSETLGRMVPLLLAFASLTVLIPIKAGHYIGKAKERLAIFASGLYCGYFGPGQGVMVAATLVRDATRHPRDLNGTKNFIIAFTSMVSNVIFVASGAVHWGFVAILAIGATIGGWLGGRWAGRMSQTVYRAVLMTVGLSASAWLFNKYWLS